MWVDLRARAQADDRVAGALLFAGLWSVFVATSSRSFVNVDAWVNSTVAWRIGTTGMPWLDGLEAPENYFAYSEGPGGHTISIRSAGQLVLGAPFYLGSSTDSGGFSITPGGLAAATYTAIAMLLLFLALRSRFQTSTAAGATVLTALTTPVWTVSADALWTHPVTVLGLCGAMWGSSRNKWLTTGLWLGLAITARPHIAITAALVGLGLAWARRDWRIALWVGVGSGSGLFAGALWSKFFYGYWSLLGGRQTPLEMAIPGVQSGLAEYTANFAGYFVSPERGLLVWTPAILVLTFSAIKGWNSAPDWMRWVALGGLAYFVVQSAGGSPFHGADAFWGYRYAIEPVVAAAPIWVHGAMQLKKRARAVLALLLTYQAGAMAVGSVVPPSVSWHDVWSGNSLVNALADDYRLATTSIFALGASAVFATFWPWATRSLSLEPLQSSPRENAASRSWEE